MMMMTTHLRRQFKRKQWVANSADPTQVIRYSSRFLTMVDCTWAIDARVHIGQLHFRFHNNRFFNWLFGLLESNFAEEQNSYMDDPMGYPGDYI